MIIKVIPVESAMISLVVEKWVGVILLIIFKKSYLDSWKPVLMMSQQGFTASSCKMKIQKIANNWMCVCGDITQIKRKVLQTLEFRVFTIF